MITFSRATKYSVSCLAILSVLAPAAFSQDVTTDVEEATDRRLQTVTVTSTKREQTLQDIPVAVSVVDETIIEQAEILDLSDLQSLVPSLRVNTYQSSAQTAFIIRGFGNGDNNAGVEPSVGVFIDGVYRSRSAAQIADLPNLKRVEVLRGPQSTLFGKNASAGVISIVTREPQFEQEAHAELSVGNYKMLRVAGDITGPITDKVAYSLAANINTRDGYANDRASMTDVNDRNRWGLRGQLLIEPDNNLAIRLIGDYDAIDEVCCIASNLVNGPTGAAIFALGGQIDAESPFSYDVYYNFPPVNDVRNYGLSGQIDYDFGFADLTSITAYRVSDLSQNSDGDFTSADLLSRLYSTTVLNTFTQEIRLASSGGENSDWMVGGFFFDESVDIGNELYYGSDFRGYADFLSGSAFQQVEALLGLPVGSTFGQSGQGLTESFSQDDQAWSVFGTVDAYLTDRFTATVGLNFTSDEKDARGSILNTDTFSALDFVTLGNNVIYQTAVAQTLAGYGIDPTDPAQVAAFATGKPADFAQIQAGARNFANANDTNGNVNSLLALQALQFFPPFLSFPNGVEDGNSQDEKLTYSFRLAYKVTDNVSVYGSVGTGFKATSWNLSRDSRPVSGVIPALANTGLLVPNLTTGTRYAAPEESTVYEIGLKAAFDSVAVNLAVFDQEIRGFQSNVFTGTGFALSNAGIQSTKGVEADVTWSPLDGLKLVAAGTFMDPVYDEFTNSTVGDISGQRPQGVSETSVSLAASYDFVLPNGWNTYIRGDYQYESDAFLSDERGTDTITRDVNVFNASVGTELANGMKISFWGRNLLDDEYLIEAFPSVAQAGSQTAYPNQPATYGVTLSKDF